MVYWHMACMLAANPTELADFAAPTPADIAKVRALILREHAHS